MVGRRSAANEQAIIRGVSDISGMVEVYALRRSGSEYRYERVFSRLDSQSVEFKAWADRHNAELFATMATSRLPIWSGYSPPVSDLEELEIMAARRRKCRASRCLFMFPAKRDRLCPGRFASWINAEITSLMGLMQAPQAETLR